MKDFYKNKNILVTGGAGFIGSTLVRKLVSFGANVKIIDTFFDDQGGNEFNLKGLEKDIKIFRGDTRNIKDLEKILPNSEIIFNMAGTLSHVDSMNNPWRDLEINTISQINILEYCRKKLPETKILFAGTRNQYGRAQYLPVDEKHPMIPTDTNGINKHAGEQYHLLYYRDFGLKSCSIRISNTYGPRHQMKHPRQGVLNWFIRQLIDDQTVELHGTGNQIRDINYVDDVVDSFLLSGKSNKVWGNAYNIGGNPISLKDFVKKAIQILERGKYKIIEMPQERKKVEIGDFVADYSKITHDIRWKPKVSLEKGLKKTFDFYLRNKKYYW
ncbi:MAG: NAD-dependent epimerase/dehydratase family protein [Patescibacteria group bacterium]